MRYFDVRVKFAFLSALSHGIPKSPACGDVLIAFSYDYRNAKSTVYQRIPQFPRMKGLKLSFWPRKEFSVGETGYVQAVIL